MAGLVTLDVTAPAITMGLVQSMYDESLPPRSSFSTKDIPDLSGKVIIVTGANTGIGKETARALLVHNAKVYIACRHPEKAAQTIKDLKKDTEKEALFLKLDLGNLKSVKVAAEEFIAKEKELHVLFNNAGVMTPPISQLTAQGYDLQFGTNVLGHFYFTKLLIPLLLAGTKSSPDGKARIVNTSSSASIWTDKIDFNTLSDTAARKRKGPYALYFQSKLGNVLVSNEYARRYGNQGIVSTSLNPGNIQSELVRYMNPVALFFAKFALWETRYGALTQLWAGTSPEGAELNGEYLIPWARVGTGNKIAQDLKLREDVWNWLEEQIAKSESTSM
ncbi:NAD(P)-binding protein [Pholiota conissans]|uniref:NAD(P)-binding protein n=1 Tax=Pholiota conissans TaxID=109636 RepID=A0A9P5Z358_9AGAR|nr:NAD(P)-binding protein [Pholiota conissans]